MNDVQGKLPNFFFLLQDKAVSKVVPPVPAMARRLPSETDSR